ncbi:MAG: acetate--CoA ligase family protein, partial [Hyphomicrobiaceae bacterium]
TDSIEVARRRIAGLRGARLLDGVRGEAPGDVGALAELMVDLSKFVVKEADRISEIDLNPVLVHVRGEGVTVVDALISRIAAV